MLAWWNGSRNIGLLDARNESKSEFIHDRSCCVPVLVGIACRSRIIFACTFLVLRILVLAIFFLFFMINVRINLHTWCVFFEIIQKIWNNTTVRYLLEEGIVRGKWFAKCTEVWQIVCKIRWRLHSYCSYAYTCCCILCAWIVWSFLTVRKNLQWRFEGNYYRQLT